jgi:hypothetical protein
MSDEERRKAQRRSVLRESTALETARAQAAEARSGFGVMGVLQPLIGEWCYFEGCKMNYRGILRDIVTNVMGDVMGVLCEPLSRVGEWQDIPTEAYEETLTGMRYLQWEGILECGKQQAHWPKKLPAEGIRERS